MEGRAEGRVQATVESFREFGVADSSIIEKLMQKFNLTREEAARAVATY